ncbi:MAG TPA: inositol monophosphatase family protein, partial [Nitrosospira sp.]|nr:inositol monophosphatase family protein [Nitrosospira sp.]
MNQLREAQNGKVKAPEQEDVFIQEIEELAKRAGEIVKDYYAKRGPQEFKSERQVVTDADRESEKLLKEGLLRLHSCNFCGEESGGDVIGQGDQWIVDPLDGTENVAGYPPLLAISIGLLRDGKPVLGVVYDPIHHVLYSARQGGQANVNGEVTQVSKQTDPARAIVAVDFSSKMETRPQTLGQLSKVLEHARAVRVLGTPALSLAAVAAGRLDLFFRPSTKLTDLVAGVCIVRASGGRAVDFDGTDWTIHSKGIIAGSAGMIGVYAHCFR